MHMSACALGGQKRAPDFPRTGAAGCCKPSDMGAENYTQGVCRRTKHSASSLQPLVWIMNIP